METETFNIKTKDFEGPFALLLSLVEKRKLFINDVSLSEVTEDYLNYIGRLEDRDPEELSSFLLVASALILIKSKSLLPGLDLTEDEQKDIRVLEERLRLYEIYSALWPKVKNSFGEQIIFAPLEKKNNLVVFLPDDQISKDSMMTFAKGVLGGMPKKVFLPKVEVKKVLSIEEMIDSLTERIKSSLQTSFRDLHGAPVTREQRVVVIVGFLAMLELVRQGVIEATQKEQHGDIIMEKWIDN
ncbi:MAG: segregation/condensation protein A [Candidatus Paceibacterota bacterium]